MRRLKRGLALVLTLCMLLSFVPAITPSVNAADTTTDDFYRIVHLDCGRKYFTADWIKSLIDEMATAGYTHLELAFGNDGLRFLLNDMSVTVDGTTYSSEDVTAGIQAGNKAYYDFTTNELTQAEMDGIIAHANEKGIGIIPLLNTPGHMDAIVTAMGKLGISNASYNGSKTTVDLSNTAAVRFTQALVTKYVNYFAGKGCTIFNMGCDEYANDIYTSGSMGFGNLESTGKYGNFVTYVNDVAAIVKGAGMTPMAFNDGIYFNNNTSSGTFDTDIMISFWTSGWGSYKVASASTIASKGHKMINTHGDFYYVLGKNDKFDSGSSYASNWDNTTFPGGTVNNPAGAMFCIWCDYPNAETEEQIYNNVVTGGILSAMSQAMGYTPEETEPDPEPVTVTDETYGVSVTAPGLEKVEVSSTDAVTKEDGTVSKTYSITLNDGKYTERATVKIPYDNAFYGCVTFSGSVDGTTFGVSLVDGYFVAEVPHFSTLTIEGKADDSTEKRTVDLEVGKDFTDTISGVNYEGTVDTSKLDTNIATVDVTGTDAVEATTTYTQASVTCNTLISSNSSNWTAASGYYYTPDGTNYYPVYAKRSSSGRYVKTYTYTWGYSVIDSVNEVTPIGNTQSTLAPDFTAPDITVYTKSGTEGTPASTTITFTGVFPGTTYVTVGNIEYTIHVAYKQATVKVVLDGTKTVNVSGDLDASNLDTSIATVSVENGVMTVTGTGEGETTVTVGDTIYTIIVAREDLTTVRPLTVDFWITNQPVDVDGLDEKVETSSGKTVRRYYEYPATTEGIYSESGILFSSLVPATGTGSDNSMALWKGTCLDSSHKQTNGSGVDQTQSGHDFTYVRYWNSSWSFSADGATWTDIKTTDQIVAYYLQVTNVTDEVTTQVVDWGPQKENWSDLNYLGTKYVIVDYSVKYESGEETPNTFPNAKSLAFHCDVSTEKDGYYYRSLGMIRAVETANYEVYMITVTPTNDRPDRKLAATAARNSSYSYDGTEVVAWVATQADLDASDLDEYTSISGAYSCSIGGDPVVSGLEIYRQHGMKVTYYVRAKATEDSLAVHYIDQTANHEFYSYNIAVKNGTLFNENIGLSNPWKGELANGSVTNLLDKTQTVSADLSTMPAIGAQYRYSEYTCVNVERSEDGKEVYLYYTFNNAHSFVVDFGLPVNIMPRDIGIEGDWTSATVTGAEYGTATASVGEGLTYTPNQVITGVESLQLTLTEGDVSVTHQIYLYPATTVYYEEGFAAYTGQWTGTTTTVTGSGESATSVYTDTQTASVAGSKANYGYDAKYANEANGPSNGTEAVSPQNSNDLAEFTFTGTGVDIYANCTTDTGMVMVVLRKENISGDLVQLLTVDTKMAEGETTATEEQNVNGYNIPIVSLTDLPYGNYHVSVIHVKAGKDEKNRNGGVKLDGFRVYGTLNDEALHNEGGVYYQDQEDKPTFLEMRNKVLSAYDVSKYDGIYASQISGQVFSKIEADLTEGAVVISSNTSYDSDKELKDLLENGPKNELYLQPNQTLVFNITTDRKVQIGLKALNKATSYSIAVDNSTVKTDTNFTSSTDMFYTVLEKADHESERTITITNTGTGILSITKLKISDDPDAALGQLTQEDLVEALVSLGFEKSAATRFNDISEDKWYYNAVEFVTGRGYFVGVADDLFGPNQTMTRGMFVTVLGRAAKVNKADYADADTGFKDVKSGEYYAPYVAWAKENGIVYGKTETEFCPNMTVTREEMAAFMCRFARYLGLDTTVKDSGWMDRYTDAGAISAYARNSIGWCVETGIITGTSSTTVSPKDLATRAQVATVIKNLVQKVIERK